MTPETFPWADLGIVGVALSGLFMVLKYLQKAHEDSTKSLEAANREHLQHVQGALEASNQRQDELHREHRAELATLRNEYRADLNQVTTQFSEQLDTVTERFGSRLDGLGSALHGVQGELSEIRIEMRKTRKDQDL